ncbi:hypothetical protein PV08_09614 [Exophiala spinifera]|uniref:DUF7730 domain-containing protein n=1 Tax=Exophiala spinifera TaxID=91928 RepID=A0A0D1ZHC6_9EURO|nr:uncharacterized protein PV08_09614 [Exophiala spinifera]KIW12337.1 hypothetical protein PV08_09614 [Exophiala spinifera]
MTSPRKTRRPVQPRPKQPASVKPQHPQTINPIRQYVPSRRQQSATNATPQAQTSTQPTPAVKPIKPFPFFKLPGEIRNRIYDLVVPDTQVSVTSNHPQKEYNLLKAQNRTAKQVKCPRHRLSGRFQGEAAPVVMLLTCRQMYEELAPIIYSRTTFSFDSFVIINKLLNRVKNTLVANIERLEVTHKGYSEPALMADREWKLRHDARWAATLGRIKAEMEGLRRLKLDLTIYDWPCSLTITEKWAHPLLHLAGNGLERVDISLEHDRFHQMKCATVARELESKMMTPKGRKMKIREDKRRAEEKQKAKKILTIKLPLNDKTTSANLPLKKVVKTTGLDGYAQAQLPVATCSSNPYELPVW